MFISCTNLHIVPQKLIFYKDLKRKNCYFSFDRQERQHALRLFCAQGSVFPLQTLVRVASALLKVVSNCHDLATLNSLGLHRCVPCVCFYVFIACEGGLGIWSVQFLQCGSLLSALFCHSESYQHGTSLDAESTQFHTFIFQCMFMLIDRCLEWRCCQV